ncbi:MAG: bifunctional transaldolase/phosoglucose isomerase [Acidobacteriota bacterium]
MDSRFGSKSTGEAVRQWHSLPADLNAALESTLEDWRANGKARRLWSGDASLWTHGEESKWLGWLGITDDQSDRIKELNRLAGEVKKAGFTHVLLLGMGGSSLCPDVLKHSFGRVVGYPLLSVLDSTDPQQIAAVAAEVDLAKTLFIVSSKSGSTLEPNIFKKYFLQRAKEAIGNERVGSHFVAVTDPGSDLHRVAEEDGFRHVYFGLPSVGGRYSALSNFGMVPAVVMGVEVGKLLDRANQMAVACSPRVPVQDNPGVVLGVILGLCGISGRDKVTLVASPQIRDFGAWLEQLLAESTGKMNKGLIPVDGEQVGPPEVYSEDRVFVYLRLETSPDQAQDQAVSKIAEAGHPVVRLSLKDLYDLGREFFRWEIATAVAGSIIGVNPFDQPDVEASKVATRALTEKYERSGALPVESPFFEQGGLQLFARDEEVEELRKVANRDPSLPAFLRAHLQRLRGGDYLGILAYIERSRANQERLQGIRQAVRDRYRVATCLGFGPRFLHSTGQAYKGGPNTGVFLQITSENAKDIRVPGQTYTFGVVEAAQADGDFQVLNERRRRALRIHLPPEREAGLEALKQAIRTALAVTAAGE